jgi:hypothetical protein
MCEMTQGIASQKRKENMHMRTAFKSKVKCEANIRRKFRGSFRSKYPNSGLRTEFSSMTMPLTTTRQGFRSSCLRNPLQNGPSSLFTRLSPLQILELSKMKRHPEGTKICRHSWHLTHVTTLFLGIPEDDFQDCVRPWHLRLTKCKASQGEHLEGECSR